MNNDGGNMKTIEDLDDNVLTQILFRLPSCPPIVAYKLVNKRWCSLISDPKFASHFSNHKKETLSKPGFSINDDDPPWTFIANLIDANVLPPYQYSVCNASNNESVFGSPKFSMGFLPRDFLIETTFKDLVLCSGKKTTGGDRVFYIANPLTKQWVVLPPCPPCLVVFPQWGLKPWVGLVCQEPCDYTQDYKFRVVVIDQFRPPVYELLVYCSEIGEWKKFNLRVSINPELAAQMHHYNNNNNEFQGVVCNGIIYLHQRLCFAAFNPFDVDETTDTTTIEAKVLPSLPYPIDGYLRESSGQLFIMHNPERDFEVDYNKNGTAIELPLMVWKLDPNLVPLIWKTTFEGSCTGNVNKIEGIEISYHASVSNVGMHPNNDKLIYMHLSSEEQLVVCDTGTRLIKPLKSLPRYYLESFDRLELQWWPTSVPKAYLSNASQ